MNYQLNLYEAPLAKIVPVQVESAVLMGSSDSGNESFGGEYYPD